MKKFVIGKKVGMTQIVDADGRVIPVTVVKVEPCQVVDIQAISEQKASIVLGAHTVKASKLNKPERGFFEKKEAELFGYLKGFQVDNGSDYSLLQKIGLEIFEENEKVNIRAKTIGRGFTGTIKRHNFSRGPMAHGSKSHRIPGSIGAGTTPGRVVKGKKMAGHYGDSYVTIKNMKIVKIDSEGQFLFVCGAVPGKAGTVEIYN